MNLRVVSNSTPLIALARIRRFQLDFKDALDELLAQGFRLSKEEYVKILEQAS